MTVTTIISDLFGVLLLKDPAWDGDRRWEARLGLQEGALGRALFDRELDEAALVGQIAQQELLRRASLVLGVDVEVVQEITEQMWASRTFNKELATFLNSLRSCYRVALLSNAWSDARRDFKRLFQLDRFVDMQLFSAEEGFAKPDERLYLLALERLDVTAEEVILLDDRVENVEAARRLGMKGVLFEENERAMTMIRRILEKRR